MEKLMKKLLSFTALAAFLLLGLLAFYEPVVAKASPASLESIHISTTAAETPDIPIVNDVSQAEVMPISGTVYNPAGLPATNAPERSIKEPTKLVSTGDRKTIEIPLTFRSDQSPGKTEHFNKLNHDNPFLPGKLRPKPNDLG